MRFHAPTPFESAGKKYSLSDNDLFSDSIGPADDRKRFFPSLVKSMVVCLAIGASTGVSAQTATQFSLTPYIWLPTINSKINYPVSSLPNGGTGTPSGQAPDGSVDSEIGPNDYLSKLNFALMLNGEVRHGPWSATFDYIGVKATGLSSQVNSFKPFGLPNIPVSNSVNTSTTSTLKTTLWTLTAGYELIGNDRMRLDGFAGARFGNLESTVDWNLSAQIVLPNRDRVFARQGSASASRNFADGIVGVRGSYRLSEQWSIPYYVDVGGGASQTTWQAMLGASYRFGWGDLIVAYRHLSMRNDENTALTQFELSGPMIGATFRF